jgi:hypothetical protein
LLQDAGKWEDSMNSSLVSKVMKPVVAMVGLQNRLLVRVPVVGKKMVEGSSAALGKLAPRLSFLGFRNQTSYENALWNWENFLAILGADYEKETVESQRNVYTFRRCPAGYCGPDHLAACEATMQLDHNLVKSSGAKLLVEKCIPKDGVCVETLVSAEETD